MGCTKAHTGLIHLMNGPKPERERNSGGSYGSAWGGLRVTLTMTPPGTATGIKA